LTPRDAAAHARLGAALLAAKQPRQAAVAAAAALAIAPEDAAALSVRCIALRQVGDPQHRQEADATCARVAERQPRIARTVKA
jgi:Flp pilus assembly protein TadD